MEKWYQSRYRRTLLDMHIEDWDDKFLSQYDPEHYFKQIQKGEINAAMIYVQSHVGLCYWPTKTGVMHRAMIGKEDQVKRLFDLCNQNDIKTILYYSEIFNNREYERHPDWRMLDYKGQGSREHGGRYGLCCPNSEGYQEFLKVQIQEFSEYFQFDGVFFDMTFWPVVCYCPSCQKRWAEHHSTPMPHTIDWNDPEWLEFNRLRHEWLGEYALMLTAEVKKHRPEASVEHQYGNSLGIWRFGNNENITLASDYIGTDLYGGVYEQSFACKAWYHLTQNPPFQYMTSRAYPSLQEHTTTKTYDQLRQCVAMTYLHHGASFLIDAIDPIGTIDDRVYDLIGKIFGEVKQYEPYLDKGKLAYDVCLYFNLNGKMDVEENGADVMDPIRRPSFHAKVPNPHFEALMGASKALAEHHIPYSIINSWKPEDMEGHKVVALPDAPFISDQEADVILRYVEQGGALYLSKHSAPQIVERVFSVRAEGLTDHYITYLSPTADDGFMQDLYSRQHPMGMLFEKALKMPVSKNAKVHATLTLPYTAPGIFGSMFPTDIPENQYITRDNPGYQFATIHANPPGIQTEYVGIMEAKYGKGTVIWSAIPFEKAERSQHREIFARIMTYLAGDFQFSATAPESVECILFDAPEEKLKLLGLIETREDFKIPTTHDTVVRIACESSPKGVYLLPQKEPLLFTFADRIVEIKIDQFNVFCMLAVEF
jgi:hypothetical protein